MIIPLCLLLSIQLFGQRKKKIKADNFITVQGGLLHDKHSDPSITGFNMINLGWSKAKDNVLQSIEMEWIGFSTDKRVIIRDNDPWQGFTRERKSYELIYARTYALFGDINNGFYVGPTASLNLNENSIIPATTADFPTQESCYCVGIGVKANYSWSITEKLFLNFSSRMTFIDIGWLRTQTKDPTLTIRQQRSDEFKTNFLRKQFPLMIGVSLKL